MESREQRTINYETFECGYCVKNLNRLYKWQTKKERITELPTVVVLLHHNKYGYVLFDTGYSTRICQQPTTKVVGLLPKTLVGLNNI